MQVIKLLILAFRWTMLEVGGVRGATLEVEKGGGGDKGNSARRRGR
jgi:hypothetical protein